MINKTIASLLLACLCVAAAAQTISPVGNNVHYVGVQANQLIRQILNFSNNANTITNPYLLTYAVNRDSVGLGLNIGLGFNFDEFKTGDATLERSTKINELFFRIGFEHKYRLGRKLITSWGVDILFDRQHNETEAKTLTDFNNSSINTSTRLTGAGLGPRFTLSYQLSRHFLIGTECTYYFKSLKNKGKVVSKITTREFDPLTGQERTVTHTDTTDNDDEFKKLQLNVPSVIYAIVKF